MGVWLCFEHASMEFSCVCSVALVYILLFFVPSASVLGVLGLGGGVRREGC